VRRHKQKFGKIATTVVLDKDENFVMIRVAMTSELTYQRNDVAITYSLAAVFLGTGNCSSKIDQGSFFLQKPP